jgi:hypothetical protein
VQSIIGGASTKYRSSARHQYQFFTSRRNNMHSTVRSNNRQLQIIFVCLVKSALPDFTLLGSSDVSGMRFTVTLLYLHHSESTKEYLCPTGHSSCRLSGSAKWSDLYV